MTLRVLQVSDCHVSADSETLYRGLNARANLERVLDSAREWRPDLVLATGDLSEDATAASYDWLEDALATLEAPILALPGNHDDPQLQRQFFPMTATEAPLVLHADTWRLVLLNSSVPGMIAGRLSRSALALLDNELAADGAPVLLSLHHQPLPVGSPWIDRYPLQDPAGLLDIIERREVVRIVTWGHVHHAVALRIGAAAALGSPSTASNSLPGQDRFSADPNGPAARWFELEENGQWKTGLIQPGAAI